MSIEQVKNQLVTGFRAYAEGEDLTMRQINKIVGCFQNLEFGNLTRYEAFIASEAVAFTHPYAGKIPVIDSIQVLLLEICRSRIALRERDIEVEQNKVEPSLAGENVTSFS